MLNFKILGYANYLPEEKLQLNRQTIYHVGQNMNQIDMAERVCKEALENAKLKITDIDLIIAACTTMAQPVPSNSSLIHERIAKGTGIPAFDVNTSCSSFTMALILASNFFALKQYKRILIVTADNITKGISKQHKITYKTFSDGAAAFVISDTDEDKGIVKYLSHTFSEGAHTAEVIGGGTLSPLDPYKEFKLEDYFLKVQSLKFTGVQVKSVTRCVKEFLKANNLTMDDIDIVIPQQTSFVLDMVMKIAGVPKGKYINWFKQYGNMGASSVPYILAELLKTGQLEGKKNLMIIGVGAGVNLNIALIKL